MNADRNSEEKSSIKKAIMAYYHEGHVKEDPKLYNHILHESWKFFLHNEKGQLRIVDKKEYYSWYNPDAPNQSLKWKTTFKYIDVTDRIGSAKIVIENQNVSYTDYFNLMKIEETWWIVHKISIAG
ncbi:MAG: nuclear transport factor 2 family protein [Candidatus Hodarchaeales archaeon]